MKLKILLLKCMAVQQGYNVKKLAAVAGLSENTVSNVFNGKTCNFTTAYKLAKALNVSAADIIEE